MNPGASRGLPASKFAHDMPGISPLGLGQGIKIISRHKYFAIVHENI